jgi:hypothetical protein
VQSNDVYFDKSDANKHCYWWVFMRSINVHAYLMDVHVEPKPVDTACKIFACRKTVVLHLLCILSVALWMPIKNIESKTSHSITTTHM